MLACSTHTSTVAELASVATDMDFNLAEIFQLLEQENSAEREFQVRQRKSVAAWPVGRLCEIQR